MTDPERPPEAPDNDWRAVLQVGGCAYTTLLIAAFVWLSLREALGSLPRDALGDHGLLISTVAGLAAGLLGTAALWAACRGVPALGRIEAKVSSSVRAMTDGQILGLGLFGALAEELFFRLAVLDALGFWWSVALYTLLNTGPGFWAWTPVALLMGLGFGVMVESGLGLLSVTTAHALINYLTLRRMHPS